MEDALFIYTEAFLKYKFNDQHPFNQIRVKMAYDLLKSMDVLNNNKVVTPEKATDEEIALFHNKEYINAVKSENDEQLMQFGIGTEDTPSFPNMHEASAHIVGATLQATKLVMEGKAKYALNLGGGLHHSHREKASGFCIYNDCAIAIEYIRKNYGAKVLYIDTDAHHGDGVQWGFYDSNDVCTVSIHETGRYLFPGTGHVSERGYGSGHGFSFNLPLDAYTEDASFISSYEHSVKEIAEFFQPDVIITQNGADAHAYDPLTHLMVTMDTYYRIPKLAKEIADTYCQGRWIALGGGGYDIWRVVPRAWSLIWLEMVGSSPQPYDAIPEEWLAKWQAHSPISLPNQWGDNKKEIREIPRKLEIEKNNLLTTEKLLSFIK